MYIFKLDLFLAIFWICTFWIDKIDSIPQVIFLFEKPMISKKKKNWSEKGHLNISLMFSAIQMKIAIVTEWIYLPIPSAISSSLQKGWLKVAIIYLGTHGPTGQETGF